MHYWPSCYSALVTMNAEVLKSLVSHHLLHRFLKAKMGMCIRARWDHERLQGQLIQLGKWACVLQSIFIDTAFPSSWKSLKRWTDIWKDTAQWNQSYLRGEQTKLCSGPFLVASTAVPVLLLQSLGLLPQYSCVPCMCKRFLFFFKTPLYFERQTCCPIL